MSIPLDRLYHYLDDLIQEDVLIYRFFPHGSKKLDDLKPLDESAENWVDRMTRPMVFVHDQEPLNFDHYSWQDLPVIKQTQGPHHAQYSDSISRHMYQHFFDNLNIRMTAAGTWQNIYDYSILIHSEKNSQNIDLYKHKNFVPVYWWCHAVIARDWFRYAEHDPALKINFDRIQHDFLIYNRAWSGTREYRLKFVELLLKHQLLDSCQTTFSPMDSDIYYQNHKFVNSQFQISICNIEQQIPENLVAATASADYVAEDYQCTGIEVVLETLFDDQRHHLTEKALRPIACGRPFMLASTPGSLKYLQSYGFQTFGTVIDESYDSIKDPVERLQAIVTEMQRISQLPRSKKIELFEQLYQIADHNKKLFFSDAWHSNIVAEFQSNFQQSLNYVLQHRTGKWLQAVREFAQQYPELQRAHQQDLPSRTLKELHTVLDIIGHNKY